MTVPDIRAYTRDTHGFSALGGYQYTGYELSGSGEPAQVNAARMTAGVFSALGVPPLLGRVFTAEEDEHSQQVAVLSYGTWVKRFHRDAKVLGTKILSRSQALCGDRRDAAGLPVSDGDGAVVSHGFVGTDELQTG